MRALAADLAAALFPARCPGCGDRGEPICSACRSELRPPPPSPPPPGIGLWVAAFEYSGVAREVIARVKYHDERGSVAWLARRTAQAAHPLGRSDIVSWPPTTAGRRRARGFDHAALLASGVARELRTPAVALLRRVDAVAQTGRPARDRRSGPAFEVSRPCAGARVLLVDDVATTGATLSAAARAVREAGATTVVAATAARTPPRW